MSRTKNHCLAALSVLLLSSCVGEIGAGAGDCTDCRDSLSFSGTQDDSPLQIAADIARSASYISVDYSDNGCHDRATLLAAELASAGIASNVVFLVPQPASQKLTPRAFPGLEWNYHVAPILIPDPDARLDFMRIEDGNIDGVPTGAFVVDPAMYPSEIVVPLRRWVADMTWLEQDAFLSFDEARNAQNKPKDEQTAMANSAASSIRREVHEMPSLYQYQLSSACSFLARDLGILEGELGAERVSAIRQEMNVRVSELVLRMQDQSLLLEPGEAEELPCWNPNYVPDGGA